MGEKKYLDLDGLKNLVDNIKSGNLVSGKSISDASGNSITDTYATKEHINGLNANYSADITDKGAQKVITGISQVRGKLDSVTVAELDTTDISLKEEINVLGVNVGALSNGTSLSEGTSITDILKAILINVKERTVKKPTSTITGATNETFEVGYHYSKDIGHIYIDGSFDGLDTDGFKPTSIAAGCGEGDTTYKLGTEILTGTTVEFTVANESKEISCTTTYGESTNNNIRNDGTTSDVNIPSGTTDVSKVTVNGLYRAYLGYANVTQVSQVNSDVIKSLNAVTKLCDVNGNVTLLANGSKLTSDGKSIVVAVPFISKLVSVSNGFGADILRNFSVTGTAKYTFGDTTTDYNVYIYPITNGASVEYQNVVVSKK